MLKARCLTEPIPSPIMMVMQTIGWNMIFLLVLYFIAHEINLTTPNKAAGHLESSKKLAGYSCYDLVNWLLIG